jgi:hypothetical protein
MTYTKLVNGEPVPMNAQEIAERQAEEAAWLKEQPLKEWQSRIAATDAKLPRAIEDIIDALDAPIKSKIAKDTLDAYNAKKQIRQEKPKEQK